ncbi:uncharacterized protein LACBIDRAFT_311548 [Laccaria bicolor S238N-H82]|uniref:Predicted protein n=1 Tax=Laccaria bicolor (strain S238N-H82 / ATCC MYA-4686) TaxID=486041 RepID=B0CXN5_LACBS|nr:uncharacterized protein LACBIDRAFT_311548 [Laccaria bicolor S238N-H82]EDR12294.1 predicted protein [Laccaria bicolor S238N-H82]|eukprot:XP_001876558.1 predicted protein [Laccaria bicolor S238N-H82]
MTLLLNISNTARTLSHTANRVREKGRETSAWFLICSCGPTKRCTPFSKLWLRSSRQDFCRWEKYSSCSPATPPLSSPRYHEFELI